jgi:hypothetical protein
MPISHGEKYISYVNSYNRVVKSDSTSNFSVQINLPKNNVFDRVVVSQVSIPKSYYMIPLGYNTFTLQEPTKLSQVVTIPAGNYTRTNLLLQLALSLNTASALNYILPVVSPYTYNVTASTLTGKLVFTCGGINQPSFSFTTNVYEQLGFPSNSTNTFVGNVLISTNCIKLQLEDTLFILSDCSNALSGVLQEVYCNSADFSNITFFQQNAELYSKHLICNQNNVFRFTLTDENFRPINLNGLNMNMTLIFYKNNDESEISKENILLNNMEKMNEQNIQKDNLPTELFS